MRGKIFLLCMLVASDASATDITLDCWGKNSHPNTGREVTIHYQIDFDWSGMIFRRYGFPGGHRTAAGNGKASFDQDTFYYHFYNQDIAIDRHTGASFFKFADITGDGGKINGDEYEFETVTQSATCKPINGSVLF